MRIALLILPCLLCAEECNEDVALLQALQPGKPTETLNVTTPDPHDAQSVMGVRGNSVGDEKAFLSGLTTNAWDLGFGRIRSALGLGLEKLLVLHSIS
ncbi:unnamed protein product [Effrenium voratum]|nr:unnamed protein product [Effrenium voratum]